MTDNEYLETLNLLEGSGDKWGKTKTSPKYGITAGGVERITRNMISKDAKGNYTPYAISIQNMFSPELRRTLLDNAVWKDKTLKGQASLNQIAESCDDCWEEMALALREINRKLISDIQTIPLTDDMQDRLCLSAHNREGIIKSPKMRKVIAGGNEEEINHAALNYLDNVDKAVLPGIRRRQAAIFNPEMPIKEAWKHFDKDGRENINFLVDEAYAKENEKYEKRMKDTAASQAIASRYGIDGEPKRTGAKPLPNEKNFIRDLLPQGSAVPVIPEQQKNEQKQPKKRSFFDRVVDGTKGFISAFTGDSGNQVAEGEQNMLNNNNGEQV